MLKNMNIGTRLLLSFDALAKTNCHILDEKVAVIAKCRAKTSNGTGNQILAKNFAF